MVFYFGSIINQRLLLPDNNICVSADHTGCHLRAISIVCLRIWDPFPIWLCTALHLPRAGHFVATTEQFCTTQVLNLFYHGAKIPTVLHQEFVRPGNMVPPYYGGAAGPKCAAVLSEGKQISYYRQKHKCLPLPPSLLLDCIINYSAIAPPQQINTNCATDKSQVCGGSAHWRETEFSRPCWKNTIQLLECPIPALLSVTKNPGHFSSYCISQT